MGKNAQKIVSCVANTTARTNFCVRMIEDLFPVGHQLMNPLSSSLLSSGSTHGRQRAAVAGQRWGKLVSAIGLEIGRQSITSDDPAANTDARVVDVIVKLDAASSEKAKRLTNLETIVRIDAGRLETGQGE